MDNTSWPEAAITSSAIISVAMFLCVVTWQIACIVRTGMTRNDPSSTNKETTNRA